MAERRPLCSDARIRLGHAISALIDAKICMIDDQSAEGYSCFQEEREVNDAIDDLQVALLYPVRPK